MSIMLLRKGVEGFVHGEGDGLRGGRAGGRARWV